MTVGPEDFFKRLEESGLLNDSIMEQKDRLQAVASGEDVAADLVGQRLLTEYQSEVLLSGVDVPMVVGDYVVTDSIGRGGMGYVLKARHRRMKRTVAIKFLLKSLTESDDLRRRFEREVEAAAQLDHQNIVTAYDAGVHEGSHYLVMQYVDGDDLSHIVKSSGPLDIPDAVDVIRQAAMGLGYAHERGIVHRDIKPGNLLLDKEGVVRILDMGLARMTPSPGDELEGGAQADLTNTGSVMGTIDYMAPEQALDAKSVDHRADVYALGCTLYFLLTGNPPFRNDTVMRRLLAHREEPAPRISAYRPEAPPELDDIFATMMAKSPDDRFPSMKHLVVALDSLGLNDSESEPMATLEVPDDGNGGFIKLTDASDASISESVNSPETTLQSDEKPSTGATRKLPVSDETILETSVNVTALDTLVDAESTPQVVTSDTDFTGIGGSHTIAGAAASRAAKSPPPWKVIAPFGLAVVALIAFLMTRPDPAAEHEEPSKSAAVATAPQNDTPSDDPQRPDRPETQSPDRRAAEGVLKLGGSVWVGSNVQQIVDPADLPTGHFVVTKIDLSEKKNIEDEFLSNFRGLADLQLLILSESSITDRGLANLTNEGRQPLPSLQRLHLDDTKISQDGLRFLSGSRGLFSLMLDGTAITEGAVLNQFPRLRNLELGQTSLTTANLLEIISRCPQLDRLTMDGRHLTETMASSLAGLPDLRALKLRDLPSDFDPGHLAKLPLLSELYVGTADSAVYDDDFWKSVAGLDKLHILMCTEGATDQSLAIARPMPQIQVFTVMSKAVTGEALAKAMSKFPNVRFLSVNYSDWTDDDIQQLHRLKSLGKLDLTKNSASAEAIKALSAALPSCLIISDHGTFEPTRSDAVNLALSFDGIDDFVECPTVTIDPNRPFTIEATVTNRKEGYGTVCGWMGNVGLYLAKGNLIGAGITTSELQDGQTHKLGTEIPDTDVLRLALTSDGKQIRLFVNGVERTSRTNDHPISPMEQVKGRFFCIGAYDFVQQSRLLGPFNGVIDEVRISSTQRYTDQYVPPERLAADEHTVALYHFDEGQGTVLKDSSGNGHHGIIHGATWGRIDEGETAQAEEQRDRQATQWVVANGGSCVIRSEGQEQGVAITKPEAIPDGPFRLVEISLSKEGIPEEEFVRLSGLTSLETVSLTDCPLTDTAFANLRDSRQLMSLTLGNTQVTDDGLAILDNFPRLKVLNMPSGITDKGFVHVLNCQRLEQLGGTFRLVRGPILNRLPELDQLQTLYIYGVDASSMATDVSRLEVFHQLPKLTVLHLFRSKLPRSLVKGLGQARQIRTLSLFHCEIESGGHAELERLQHLENLSLAGSGLSDDHVDVLSELAGLNTLDVTENELTSAGIAELRQSLPACKIISDHGTFKPTELSAMPDALQFASADDSVMIPLTYDGSHPITVEAWVKPAELGTHTNVIGNRDGLDKGLTLKIDTRAGNNRWAFLGNQASDALYVSSDGRLSGAEDSRVRLNEWTHLAGIWDGQRTQLFIDGKACRDMFVGDQKVADDASLELRQSEANFIISGSMNPFSGQIRSVRISKNVRYKDDFTPESNLSADDNTLLLYSFDESVGNTLRDTSGNGHHGKISGAKWVSVIAK